MEHINANLDKYVGDDYRVLDMDEVPAETLAGIKESYREMIKAEAEAAGTPLSDGELEAKAQEYTNYAINMIEMMFYIDMHNHIEYAGDEFYISATTTQKDYVYDSYGYPMYTPNGLPIVTDKTVTNKYWYYDSVLWAIEPGTSATGKTILRLGTLALYDALKMSTSGSAQTLFTEKFFKKAEFTKNGSGYLLVVDVSGDALEEFLYMMSSNSVDSALSALGFEYDNDIIYYFYFDANGNIEEMYVDAGFSLGATSGITGLTGSVVITQTFSEVGTLNEIKTKPIGNGFSSNEIPANPSCTHPRTKTVKGYAATCMTNGLTDGKYCTNCLADVQVPELIPAAHTLEDGVCTKCGHNTTLTEGLVFEYNSDGKTATLIGIGACRDEEIVIPADIHGVVITKIAKDAFKDAIFVKSIKIPAGVAVIEDGAFDGATNLKKISLSTVLVNKLPKNITEVEISSGETIKTGSFVDFKYLTTITLGESVESIEEGAFVGCDRLFIIYNFSDIYGIYAGEDTNGGIAKFALSIITNKNQSSNISVLGDFVFKFTGSQYNLVKYIGNDENLVLPESINGECYYIDNYVFSNVSCIKTIEGPANLKGVSPNAFSETASVITSARGNSGLISALPIDNLQYVEVLAGSVGTYFLDYAPELVEVKIHSDITGSALDNCPKLEKVTLTDSVTYIADYAFSYCKNLKEVRFGSGVNSISGNAFVNSSGDLSLYVDDAKVLSQISCSGGYWKHFSKLYVDGILTRNITITDISSIANYAFAYCDAIDSITFGEGLEIIGEYAFFSSSIEEIDFADGLTSINRYAFASTTELESIALPDSVRNIESYAFNDAKALEYINLPEGLTYIGNASFKNAVSLRSIVIPSSLTEIPNEAFYNAKSLTSVTVLSKNVNGNVSGVSKIGVSAFEGCGVLATVTLGDSVDEISNKAFYGAYKLTNLDLGVVETIGDYAFYKCESLNDLKLPNGLKTIGGGAFAYAGIHTITLPSSLTTLGRDAFIYAYGLVEVVNNSTISISQSHTSSVAKYALVITTGESTIDYVSDFAFLNVPSGTYAGINLVGYLGDEKCITLPEDYKGSQYVIGKYAFANADFASVVISSGVTHVFDYAFYNCNNLISVTIGENVTSIYANSFSGCSVIEVIKLTSKNLSLPAYVVLHDGESKIDFTEDGLAFYVNSAGTVYLVGYVGNEVSITLPELYNGKPYSIYEDALYYLNLKELIVPETLVSLGDDFINVNSVKTNVYEGVMYLGNEENPYVIALGPVNNSTNLKTLKLHDDTVMIAREAFRYQRSLESVEFGNNLRVISYAAFDGCNYLKEVILPDTVVRIEDYAFQDCYDVTTLYLSENLEYIGYHAFYYMSDLKELTIPAKLTYIGQEAFTQCCSLEKIYYNAINVSSFGNRVFDIDYGYSRKEIAVVIGDGVERIPDYAFGGSSTSPTIISITVTDINDLKFIGAAAFGANCKWETLDLPNVEYVGANAFAGATSLKSVKFVNAKNIGSNAFLNCTSLTNAEIGDAAIGLKAFMNCTALETVKLGAGATYSSGYAIFSGCTALKSVTLPLENVTFKDVFGVTNASSLPASLTKIELLGTKVYSNALQDCTKIKELVIASTVTEIGSYAFEGITGITELSLPEGLKTVGDCAFENCSNLKSLAIPRGVESIGYYILRGATKLESLEMPFLGRTKEASLALFNFVPTSTTGSSNGTVVSSLKTLKLTNVSKLATAVLAYTNNLETIIIEGDIKEIPKQCFDSSKALKSVTLPDGIESIGESAFYNCKNLASLNLPASVKTISLGALYNLQSIESLVIPEGAVIATGAIGFDETVFNAMDKSVFTEYDNAYYLGSESNKYLMLVFAKNKEITSCEIASTTKYILPYAFYNCTDLTSVEIPASVTSIGAYAFENSGITSIVIPDTVTELGNGVFSNCTS